MNHVPYTTLFRSNRDKVEISLAEDFEKSFLQKLQDRLDMVKETPLPYNYQEPQEAWRALRITRDPSDFSIAPKTGIPSETFEKILDHLTSLPENFKPVPKVNRLLRGMNRLLENDTLNWRSEERRVGKEYKYKWTK